MAIRTRPPAATQATRLVNLMTADEYRRLPETNKICELINGELVMAPAPLTKHQWVVMQLGRIMGDFVTEAELGAAFIAPFDVYLSTYEVYQPDIVVVFRENAAGFVATGYRGAPALVVEVLSPSNRKRDLVTKAAEYAAAGVPEYWVVDPVDDRIEVNRLENGAYVSVTATDGLARSTVLPGFEVDPGDVFAVPEWMTQPPTETSQED